MRTSFVGVVSRFGLESFLPESEATRRWLLQAVERYPVACVWADVERGSANEIRELLFAGDSRVALRHMAETADSVGTVLR